jgi:heptosyltransferase-2
MSASPHILVIKLADFGDALLTTPALRALRQAYPEARIDALTTPAAAVIYRHTPFVDEVLCFHKGDFDRPRQALRRPGAPLALGRALRARRYDAVVLFHRLTTRYGRLKHAGLVLVTGAPTRVGPVPPGRRRGWFLTERVPDPGFDRIHEVELALRVVAALRAPAVDRRLCFEPGPADWVRADRLLAGLPPGAGPLVGIHPGCGPYSPARRWSPAGFAAVADRLAGDGARPVLVGTPADATAEVRSRARSPLLDLTGRTDLPTLAAVLARLDLLVGNDSGVTHLATAMGTPVVAVFGPSNPVAWGPWWPGVDPMGRPAPSPHRVVRLTQPLPCQPCLYVGHHLGAPQGCPTRDCLAWLTPDPVVAAAREALAGRPGDAAPRRGLFTLR